MAADIIVYPTKLTGLDLDIPILVPATYVGGDLCPNDGSTILLLELDAAATGDVTATVDSVKACSHGKDHNSVTLVPDEKRRIVGPFDRGRFNNPAGKIAISYTFTGVEADVALLKIKAISVKPVLL